MNIKEFDVIADIIRADAIHYAHVMEFDFDDTVHCTLGAIISLFFWDSRSRRFTCDCCQMEKFIENSVRQMNLF